MEIVNKFLGLAGDMEGLFDGKIFPILEFVIKFIAGYAIRGIEFVLDAVRWAINLI